MTLGPIDLEGQPALILCFDPGLPDAVSFVGAEAATLVSDLPLTLTGAEAAQRVAWSELGTLAPGATRVVVLSLRAVRPRPLARGLRRAARGALCYLVDAPGSWFQVNRRGAFNLALARVGVRALGQLPGLRPLGERLGRELDPPWLNLRSSCEVPAELARAARAAPARPPAPAERARVVHYVGALGPGGAERQLALLAAGTQAQGIAVEVWTAQALEGEAAHYLPDLERAGVRVRCLLGEDPWPAARALRRAGLDGLREHLRVDALLPLISALLRERPDVLHCWLDEANVLGGLAGLASGVPRIVVSTRNVSPAHHPRLLKPWFLPAYRALATVERVRLVANSRDGAADYARWLGVAPERFTCVYNGFHAPQATPLAPAERATRRELLGFAPDAFVVVGVFRLAEEKRPLDFVRAIAALRERVPGVRALHLGVGDLADATRREAQALGLEGVLEFRGRVPDPWSYLQVADASLLTSAWEGCPNVVIESQAIEVPVVAAAGSGTPETLEDGETGFLCPVGDVGGLAERLAELARDPARRAAMGAAGRALVGERFGVARMVAESLALYGLGERA